MRPIETTPTQSARDLLPRATFADAFTIETREAGLDAVTAATRAMGTTPPWIARLLAVRDVLVRPLGLKGTAAVRAQAYDRIGFFPCLSRSSDRVVLGFDDWHLDFRVVVDTSAADDALKRITATTIVRPHNLLGRTYLMLVMPFHKAIVPALLKRV